MLLDRSFIGGGLVWEGCGWFVTLQGFGVSAGCEFWRDESGGGYAGSPSVLRVVTGYGGAVVWSRLYM